MSLPSFINFLVINPILWNPIRNTIVSSFKNVCHSTWDIFLSGVSCPVTTLNDVVTPLCVTGIPAYAGTDTDDVIPGIISNLTSLSKR